MAQLNPQYPKLFSSIPNIPHNLSIIIMIIILILSIIVIIIIIIIAIIILLLSWHTLNLYWKILLKSSHNQ